MSKSGRVFKDHNTHEDFVDVINFDPIKWEATYLSCANNIIPTSDTPLYWAALIEAPKLFKWNKQPIAAIHGHALTSDESARILNIPRSGSATVFSTPVDRENFLNLLKNYPYPKNKIFIRKQHGFFVLGESIEEAMYLVNDLKNQAIHKKLI